MKTNEIGHFPWLPPQNQFDKGGYPRTYIAHDDKGKCVLTADGNIKWATNWVILGEVDLVDIPKDKEFSELLIDLQTAHECYCADLLEVDGVKYVALQGSGWADEGFPFYDDTISEKDLYETGKGCYALIRGKAADEFIKIAKQDCLPSFKTVFTGDYRQDFVLPKE